MNLLEARDVSRHFGGLRAVDGVDLSLEDRGIHAIIGPNGAGKTTFVSLLCGRLSCSAGTIRFDGEDITGLPAWRRARRGIAYTFQITSIFPRLTVRENLAIAVQGCSTRREDPGPRVTDILARVDLPDRTGEAAGTLPYGHQRLLEVGMGLALAPRLLILDEPTQGLSDSEINHFCGLVRNIAWDAAVLLIEHNMRVVMELADRITVLDHGRVLSRGTPAQIRSDPAVQAAYLGTGAD
ncbi:MAG: ABC transporter ATP-binding protein [Gammaproteobacteria bacterium]|nr:ABC transporter ATP-binding protein [Gammaproteobacteria bacterium]MXX16163.1 ABC transporter ATP-binding protein [Gammaproteobacteria bacterium]MXY64250.1 ABC transporter ATP-binding protein [Gammaproteobacteria bacterium]MYG67058.1 ABC transporter ATP-binding protein [Gammaproteobacteria bacterium]